MDTAIQNPNESDQEMVPLVQNAELNLMSTPQNKRQIPDEPFKQPSQSQLKAADQVKQDEHRRKVFTRVSSDLTREGKKRALELLRQFLETHNCVDCFDIVERKVTTYSTRPFHSLTDRTIDQLTLSFKKDPSMKRSEFTTHLERFVAANPAYSTYLTPLLTVSYLYEGHLF
jgi:hypothetical protein